MFLIIDSYAFTVFMLLKGTFGARLGAFAKGTLFPTGAFRTEGPTAAKGTFGAFARVNTFRANPLLKTALHGCSS